MRLQAKSVILVIGFAMATFFTVVPAAADKLDDFKEAASKDGCEAIPYQSERIECKTRSTKKNNICKEFGCDRAAVQKTLDEYKETKQNLENAKMRNDEQGARSLANKVLDFEKKLQKFKQDAKQTVHECYDCLEAREMVQRSFSDATVMVNSEKDPALQQYITTLVAKFKAGRDEHVTPMQEVTKAADNCKWVSEITW